MVSRQNAAMVGWVTDYGAYHTSPGEGNYNWNGANGPGEQDYAREVTTASRTPPYGRTNHPVNNEFDPFTGKPVPPSQFGNGVPALKDIVRIEKGSNLSGTGENGADRGATVLKRYGVSGTLWGDPGFDT